MVALFVLGPVLCSADGIAVGVCNVLKIPDKQIARAQSTASYVFGLVGIDVEWAPCTQPGREPSAKPSFVLQFMDHPRPIASGRWTSDAFGRAYLLADGTANYAEVYYEPVHQLTTAYQLVEADDILGYAVAHELGHLLLGPRHTTRGIMSARWNLKDLQMMTQRRLRFTQAEGSAMQRKIQQEYSAAPRHVQRMHDSHECTPADPAARGSTSGQDKHIRMRIAKRNGRRVVAQRTKSGEESTISVRVHNDAEVSGRTLRHALREAKRIFSDAGINTVWSECAPSNSSVAADSVCNKSLGPMLLEVRIVPRNDEATNAWDELFGFARPFQDGGLQATAFYHRARNVAQGGTVSLGQLLGHIIAHEVGHLALWSDSHSSGIMQREWGQKALIAIAKGQLAFTREEAQVMADNVSRRNRHRERLRLYDGTGAR